MKKSILLFASGIIGSIAMSIAFFRLSRLITFEKSYYYVFGIILLIMLVSTVIYFKQMMDELRGIPSEDEMTENINRMAAARSFPYSLSMWILILIFSIAADNAVIPISIGIMGMGLIYGSYWIYYKYKGNTND
jgi:hypothetical protein